MVQVRMNEIANKSEHRANIINVTRSWIGTPYHHQQAVKNIGCDCLGLVRGIYVELYNKPVQAITPYSKDWAEQSGEETLINAAKLHLKQATISTMQPGDVIIFRFRKWMVAKHTAILTAPDKMIHAIEGAKVEEVHLGKWWRRHIASVFSFPEIIN